jgi:RNA polymerase primary sigma factor
VSSSASADAFGWYRSIASSLPPPVRGEEAVTLARAIEVGLLARERLDGPYAGELRPVDRRDLRTLAAEGARARTRLFLGTLRLVFHWTKGTAASVGPQATQDAFQAGCVGLGAAVQRWDHRRGGAFSTYASWCIRGEVRRWRTGERSAQGTPDVAERCTVIPLPDVGADDPGLSWDGGVELVTERRAGAETVRLVLSRLTERQADVLRRRHGLYDGRPPMTLDAIGRQLGVTRERARQIERDALTRLR